jgi:hypothetical protein
LPRPEESLSGRLALAGDFDGVIQWARDTKTFRSIVKELSKERR